MAVRKRIADCPRRTNRSFSDLPTEVRPIEQFQFLLRFSENNYHRALIGVEWLRTDAPMIVSANPQRVSSVVAYGCRIRQTARAFLDPLPQLLEISLIKSDKSE